MMTTKNRASVTNSLREFKNRRDALLHNDSSEMELNLRRFIEFCDNDPLTQAVLQNLPVVNSEEWWQRLSTEWFRGDISKLEFPRDRTSEIALRYALTKDIVEQRFTMYRFGDCIGVFSEPERSQRLLSLIVRPLCVDLSDELREIADIPSEEIRALQAVPLHRIPGEKETRIFLSHKSNDEALITRFYDVLRELGYSPWLDKQDLLAGTQVDRGIVDGFRESCAAIFFITENFTDERFLADEISYAKIQERNKQKKFVIIVLRFDPNAKIPPILEPYKFIDVHSELQGLHEIVRALPVELGPIRWKDRVTR